MVLKNLVAIITGAGKGLGRSIAEQFFKEGASLALFDVKFDLAKSVSRKLDPSGKRIIAIKADVTDEIMIKNAILKVLNKFRKIDVLVNNAGISLHKPIEEMSIEDFEKVINVNLTGTFICSKIVIPYMKKQNNSRVNLTKLIIVILNENSTKLLTN